MAKLTAYVLDGHSVQIRPAPLERAWMDATHERYAYRCLPLNIANGHGWEILCPSGFLAQWDGGAANTSLAVTPDAADETAPAVSHFGYGVLTFHIPCLFRTEREFDMFVGGPVNQPKDGIGALTGVIETDWAPYTFTMNWLFTRPGAVRFEAGEPFCTIFPVPRGSLEAIEPEMKRMSDEPELEALFKQWAASRAGFNADLSVTGTEAHRERWQKMYFRGLQPTGEPGPASDHRSRLRLKPFARPD